MRGRKHHQPGDLGGVPTGERQGQRKDEQDVRVHQALARQPLQSGVVCNLRSQLRLVRFARTQHVHALLLRGPQLHDLQGLLTDAAAGAD